MRGGQQPASGGLGGEEERPVPQVEVRQWWDRKERERELARAREEASGVAPPTTMTDNHGVDSTRAALWAQLAQRKPATTTAGAASAASTVSTAHAGHDRQEDQNWIGRLQQRYQSRGIEPEYIVSRIEGGPDHSPVYSAVVRVDGRTSTARGPNKKTAKQRAAASLVAQLESGGAGRGSRGNPDSGTNASPGGPALHPNTGRVEAAELALAERRANASVDAAEGRERHLQKKERRRAAGSSRRVPVQKGYGPVHTPEHSALVFERLTELLAGRPNGLFTPQLEVNYSRKFGMQLWDTWVSDWEAAGGPAADRTTATPLLKPLPPVGEDGEVGQAQLGGGAIGGPAPRTQGQPPPDPAVAPAPAAALAPAPPPLPDQHTNTAALREEAVTEETEGGVAAAIAAFQPATGQRAHRFTFVVAEEYELVAATLEIGPGSTRVLRPNPVRLASTETSQVAVSGSLNAVLALLSRETAEEVGRLLPTALQQYKPVQSFRETAGRGFSSQDIRLLGRAEGYNLAEVALAALPGLEQLPDMTELGEGLLTTWDKVGVKAR